MSLNQLTFSAQPLGEVSESFPLCGVHVDVFPITDVLVVHNVVVHSLGSCRTRIKRVNTNVILNLLTETNICDEPKLTEASSEQLQEVALELTGTTQTQ